MTNKTDSKVSTAETVTGMSIAEVVAAFSDYDSKLARIGVVALESTIAHYEDALWPGIDSLCDKVDEWKTVKPAVLNDRAKRQCAAARKAGADIKWTLSDEKLADVLKVRERHTDVRLAMYEGHAVRESSKSKRSAAVTMANYASFLGEIARKDRDEDGELTAQGRKRAAERKAATAAKAAATVPMGDVDWMRDIKGTDAEKLTTLLNLRHNLNREIAALEATLGDDAKSAKSAASKALKKAAGLD